MAEPTREFEHACTLYKLLEEEAEDGVFTGSITQLVKSMNISHVYHTSLPDLLANLGCIEIKQRGSGRYKRGVIVLHRDPDLEQYATTYRRDRLTRSATLDNIRASVEATNRRLPNIDLTSWIASVENTLADLEARLVKLEAQHTEGGTNLAS